MGWALDWELSLTRKALDGVVEFSGLDDCDVVHSMWWRALLSIPEGKLIGKRIISYVPGEPFRLLQSPYNGRAMRLVGKWIAGSDEARRQFLSMGVDSVRIPFLIDLSVFYPLPHDGVLVQEMRREWRIPESKYLIGSFQRDTEGSDLHKPKLEKGPDVIAEVVRRLSQNGLPIHVILAGPRRFWLRGRLSQYGVPFTFVGSRTDGDDYGVNILPRSKLNVLNSLIDLYIVGSRSEGGPNAILEVAASRCKVISTRVGMAEDVLEPGCIYDSAAGAVELIANDVTDNSLEVTLDAQFERARNRHVPEAVAPLLRELYESIQTVPLLQRSPGIHIPSFQRARRLIRGMKRKVPAIRRGGLTVGMWHRFREPPYGGGNQFFLALRKALDHRGVRIVNNPTLRADAHLLQAIGFDIGKFRRTHRFSRPKVIHRVAGPIQLARGFDHEKDELCMRLNADFAFATVFQSAWSYQQYVDLGFEPVNPVVIYNAADPEIFHCRGRIPFSPERRTRLISSGWSDNPRKGGAIYKWIEEHLDWDRFEYTFVGNSSESFDRIRHIPPVGSGELGDILREHDIFVFASGIESGSNSLTEALSCGLPALYLNQSSNPEVVGHGGLPFTRNGEVLPQLDAIVDNYEMFQNLITAPTMSDVADTYLELIRDAAGVN